MIVHDDLSHTIEGRLKLIIKSKELTDKIIKAHYNNQTERIKQAFYILKIRAHAVRNGGIIPRNQLDRSILNWEGEPQEMIYGDFANDVIGIKDRLHI